jgi:prevent-host-death family protein
MEQVPVRKLNQDTATVLRLVEDGETVEVTRDGRPIARIVPIAEAGLEDLVTSGKVAPATIHEPIRMPTVAAPADQEAGRLVSELRDGERW